jgi:hypothetical protein
MSNGPQCVAFAANAKEIPLVVGLAHKMKNTFGSKVFLYVSSSLEKRGLERLKLFDIFDGVVVVESVDRNLSVPVPDEVLAVSQARAWEDFIGETITHALLEERQLSRGFLPGGAGFPRSRIFWKASYIQVVNAAVKALNFWHDEIERKKIDLVINARNPCVAVCRALGIPYRRIFPSKFAGEHYWSCNEKGTNSEILAIYQNLNPSDCPPVEVKGTHNSQLQKVKDAERSYSLLAPVRYFALQIPKTLIAKWRGDKRGNLYLSDLLMTGIRTPRNTALYKRLVNTSLDKLQGSPFVYFPLHKEPETDMLARCPEYTNQITAIASLARVAPAGVRIVVKEHIPAYPYRTRQFYYGLRDFKNVMFVDAWESSIDLIKASTITATITGGAGLEGAVLGKPVIQFNRNSVYRFLPHVMTVEAEKDIARYLHRVLDGDIDISQAKIDGRRFREALHRASFDAPDYAVNYRESMTDASIQNAFSALIQSLDRPDEGREKIEARVGAAP